MSMKMMISTSRRSMSGTTWGVGIAPPLSPPTSIPIASLLVACARAIQQAVTPRRVGSGAAVENQQTNGTNRKPRSSIRRGRRRSCFVLLVLLGEQTELIDTSRANLVDNGNDVAILRACIALDVNGLVQTSGETILHLARDVFLG